MGGPQSPNYIHRTRPELCEEEDEEGSEGEDIGPLKARAGGSHPHDDEETERQKRQDLSLAKSLRLRAEGLEKVITSMLERVKLHRLHIDILMLQTPKSSHHQTIHIYHHSQTYPMF